jgi:hypothetical protein
MVENGLLIVVPISFYDSLKRHVEYIPIQNEPIWRYLNLDGALNTLLSKKLRLTRFDASPNDLNEGLLSRGFRSIYNEVSEGIAQDSGIANMGSEDILNFAEQTNREKCYSVSWSLTSPLQNSMWDNYTTVPDACAFEMTPMTLRAAVMEEIDMAAIGQTFYIEDEDSSGSSIDFTRELFRKRLNHINDNEVRMVVDTRWGKSKFDEPTGPEFPKYIYLNFDISLISRIYLSPGTEFTTFAMLKAITDTPIVLINR